MVSFFIEKQACKKFQLTSSGPSKTIQSQTLGTYIKEKSLTNGRVAYYNWQKGQYMYWMNWFWVVFSLSRHFAIYIN